MSCLNDFLRHARLWQFHDCQSAPTWNAEAAQSTTSVKSIAKKGYKRKNTLFWGIWFMCFWRMRCTMRMTLDRVLNEWLFVVWNLKFVVSMSRSWLESNSKAIGFGCKFAKIFKVSEHMLKRFFSIDINVHVRFNDTSRFFFDGMIWVVEKAMKMFKYAKKNILIAPGQIKSQLIQCCWSLLIVHWTRITRN